MDVLHITPHLGGGVGKAVSALVGVMPPDDQPPPSEALRHRIVCLEAPERDQSLVQIAAQGWTVLVVPQWARLRQEIERADVVVVHFWAHPQCAELLTFPDWPACRLVAWSHMSGLGTTRFPHHITSLVDRFLVTAPASFAALGEEASRDTVALMSSGLVEGLPPVPQRAAFSDQQGDLPVAGYVGTLNPAKIHPDYVRMVAEIPLSGFQVVMVGDDSLATGLKAQSAEVARSTLLRYVGYQADVVPWLASFHLFLYLLNPDHYGTAENALLEAMAMGVVPLVMANHAEMDIVEHERTGIVVANAQELSAAVIALCQDPGRWAMLSRNAAEWARGTFSPQRLRATFAAECGALALRPKRQRPDASAVLGSTPADWFLAFQADRSIFGHNGRIQRVTEHPHPAALEPAKGSVFHFHHAFPDDPQLCGWAEGLSQWGRGA